MPGVALLLLLAFSTLPAAAQPVADFSVGWISREPKIDYVWDSARPDREGWPEEGQVVQWTAHVRNNGTARAGDVAWRWSIDGEGVSSGTVTLEPNRYTEVVLPWTWTFQRHEIEFEIDVGNAVTERQERNNRLLIHSDALAVGFYAEQTYWNRTATSVSRFDAGATTLDDWLQIRIRQFNDSARLAGVIDRWRIDAVTTVADGSLPLSPLPEVANEYEAFVRPIRFPNAADRSVDLMWGFTSDYPVPVQRTDLLNESLIHELGHARFLVDVYAWGVTEWWKDRVNITPPPPKSNEGWHHTPHRGLMNSHWGFIDRYSAMAMNRIAGHRATKGNYNPPENLGEFLNDLPARSRVRLIRPDGTPVANVPVFIYRSSAEFFDEGLYPKTYDNTPDLERTADADGWIELPRNPFADGPLVHGRESGSGYGSNVTAIVRVNAGGTDLWGYLESLDLNLAYWEGETELAEFELVVGGPICSIARYPLPQSPALESVYTDPDVRFGWNEPTRAVERQLWISVDGGTPTLLATLSGIEDEVIRRVPRGRVAWWVVATYGDGCPVARSATWYFDHDVPGEERRRPSRRR
jgi:hypothetical protein